uniref:Uncharacterized protein n=1 Tax=Romanomermis culicivorax TaxID=13658 RepID=A0A915JQB9_ROMCU
MKNFMIAISKNQRKSKIQLFKTKTEGDFNNDAYIIVMQKCDAEMINFRGDATNTLSETVTLATQQHKLLEEFKTEIKEMKAQKRELSKLNVPEIQNIVRPTSSYAQSLKSTKPKKVNLAYEA